MEKSVSLDVSKQLAKMIPYGISTIALYALLYILEDWILAVTVQGGWYFIVPITIAFVFSFFHGTFTAQFWDVLGVKPKK